MGQTLSNAAHWTTAKEEGGRGRLEYTPTNETILNRILGFVEGFSSTHAEESKIIFKDALVWNTSLPPEVFTGAAYKQENDLVVSASEDRAGKALLQLRTVGGRRELSVRSFQMLEEVLSKADGQDKITETRLCLEANNDPVAKILGERFATIQGADNSAYNLMEEILSARVEGGTEEGGDDVGEKKTALKLLLLLRDFDDKLMQEALKIISSESKLTAPDVERSFELLSSISGPKEDTHVLREIAWTPPYTVVFANGCRAPHYRQVNGDIAYILVTPHKGGGIISLTACTSGYYVNAGLDHKTNEVRFEKVSGFYRDLIALLREKDEHFNNCIDNKEIFKEKPRTKKHVAHKEKRNIDWANPDQEHAHVEKQEKKKELTTEFHHNDMNERGAEASSGDEGKSKTVKMRDKDGGLKSGRSRGAWSSDESGRSFSESSSETDSSDDDLLELRADSNTDLPSEYWQIQKLVKYLKGGNQTATVIALCSLLDFDLQQETCQLAIRDVGGLEVLINLLETEPPKCQIGALKILREISKNAGIRRAIADLGGLKIMVRLLKEQNKELKCLSAETIANVARFRRARRAVRKAKGIPELVKLLTHPDREVQRCGALALWSCSSSDKNKKAMKDAGVIHPLSRLLKSAHVSNLIPVMGVMEECANDESYRLAIRREGMLPDIIKNLKLDCVELQTLSANTLFKCGVDKQTRDLIRQHGGLDPLVDLLRKQDNRGRLVASTGAVWKCAISRDNVERFKQLEAIEILLGLLNNQPEEVLVNVVGCLAEMSKDKECSDMIRKKNGLPLLVNLLIGTNAALLVNVNQAVGACAEDPENMIIIDRLDGVRLLWSLLKNADQEVQASAAWAICPCIQNTKDAGEMVRSFVGGLELIVGLLKSDNVEVLAAVCAALANIANDEENLAVITDHGVVPLLARLTPNEDDKLRQHLAEAIARCCNWGNNRVVFGKEGAVRPLVTYLDSLDPLVHRSTARALQQLSKDPDNCITMHDAGVVKPLILLVGSEDHVLQEAAACCLSNIRRLAMANERYRQQKKLQKQQQQQQRAIKSYS